MKLMNRVIKIMLIKVLLKNRQEQPKEKIFVNEERMAARLEQLQIDNNNLDWHPNLEQETWYSQQRARPKSLQDLDERYVSFK